MFSTCLQHSHKLSRTRGQKKKENDSEKCLVVQRVLIFLTKNISGNGQVKFCQTVNRMFWSTGTGSAERLESGIGIANNNNKSWARRGLLCVTSTIKELLYSISLVVHCVQVSQKLYLAVCVQ